MTNESGKEMEARHKARLEQIDAVNDVMFVVRALKDSAIKFGVRNTEFDRNEMRYCEGRTEEILYELASRLSPPVTQAVTQAEGGDTVTELKDAANDLLSAIFGHGGSFGPLAKDDYIRPAYYRLQKAVAEVRHPAPAPVEEKAGNTTHTPWTEEWYSQLNWRLFRLSSNRGVDSEQTKNRDEIYRMIREAQSFPAPVTSPVVAAQGVVDNPTVAAGLIEEAREAIREMDKLSKHDKGNLMDCDICHAAMKGCKALDKLARMLSPEAEGGR